MFFGNRSFWCGALAAALLSTVGATAQAAEFTLGALKINQPWTRATPPSMTGPDAMAVGYLTIANTGKTSDTLKRVSIKGIDSVTPHQTLVQEGMAHMIPLKDGIPLPVGQTVALQPGGSHLMLQGFKKALVAGQTLPATLVFEHAGAVSVTFVVEAFNSKGPADMPTKETQAMSGMPGM